MVVVNILVYTANVMKQRKVYQYIFVSLCQFSLARMVIDKR